MEKIRCSISKILVYSFAGIILWILANAILNYDPIIYMYNPLILLAGVIIYIYILVLVSKNLLPKLENKKYIHYILFAVFFLISIIVGYMLRVNPSWDMGEVYKIAKSYALTGTMGESTYLISYPNNIMMTGILTIVFKIISIFKVEDFIITATVFNAIIITATVIFTYNITNIIFNRKKAILATIIMLFTTPLYLYVAIYYTDTMSMFATTFLLWLFLLTEKEEKSKKSTVLQIILGTTIVISYKLKITSIFIIIAAVVYYIIIGIRKCDIKKFYIVIPTIFIVLMVYNFVIEDRINNRLDADPYKMPIEYWIMLGITGKGGYNEELYQYIKSYYTYEEKVQAGREKIVEILQNYTLNDFIKHLTQKLKFAWTDGTYFAPEKIRRQPVNKNILHEFVLADGKYKIYYKYFPQVMHIGIMFLILLASIDIVKKSDWKSKKMMLIIAIYGLIVFLLIWENRSRYILTMLPIFIILGVNGLDYIIKDGGNKDDKKII